MSEYKTTHIGGATIIELDRAAPPPVDLAAWFIDIGSFFDRFGPAQHLVLKSTDADVKAFVTNVLARSWIDLERPDVAAGIDVIIAASIPGVTLALKDTILTTPVTALEQLALRKLFFS